MQRLQPDSQKSIPAIRANLLSDPNLSPRELTLKTVVHGRGSLISIKRRDLARYFEQNGFKLIREGGNPSIYSNGILTAPIK